MEYPIFDTHAHYSARAFDSDRFALLDSLPGKGVVGVCEQATHSGDAPKVLELAHKYPWVYAAVGIHPESLLAPEDCGEEGPAPTVSVYGGDWAAEMRALAPYYEDPKVVAVGECGLDYHWPVPKDAQLALFEAEIRLALELDKPIIVHDRSAHADVYALLKKYRPKGIIHCYSGSADDALWLAEQGLYIGFGGACTFKGAKRAAKAIAALPLERIVLELKEHGYTNGRLHISHCGNPAAAERLKHMVKAVFDGAKVDISECGGLCSYYAELGGLLVGYEDAEA